MRRGMVAPMSILESKTTDFLNSIYRRSRTFYPKGKKPSKVNLQTGTFASAKSHKPLDTLFGFVPVFTKEGATEIYVRFGGPEVIRKMIGDGFNANPEAGSAYGKYDTIVNRERDGAGFEFGRRYNRLLRNEEYNTLYDVNNALERSVLQQRVLGLPFGVDAAHRMFSLADMRNIYKFKLVPNTAKGVFEVYYSRNGAQYQSLKSDTNAYTHFGADLILDVIDTAFSETELSETDSKDLLVSAKTESGQATAVGVFLNKLADDFLATAVDGLTYGAEHTWGDHALDQLWWSAFYQFKSKPRNKYLDIYPTVTKSFDSIKDTGTVTAACKAELKSILDRILTRYSLDSESAVAVIEEDLAARKEADDLRKRIKALESENKELESQKKHVSVHRYVGLAAGAASAYLSVKDEDVEDWVKITTVAVGGALGLVPILNYLTIAATPLIVKYGASKLGPRSIVRDGALNSGPEEG